MYKQLFNIYRFMTAAKIIKFDIYKLCFITAFIDIDTQRVLS